MRSLAGFVRQCLRLSLLGTLSVGGPSPHSRESIAKQTAAAVPLNSSAGEQNTTVELFARMTVRHHWQEAHLDRLSVIRTYKVEDDKDKTVAEEVVVMEYTAPGTEAFTSSSEKGSGFVLHHVFQRLMKDEEKRVRINKDPDSLITPENYTFERVGMDRIGRTNCFVVRAIPKRKETDLFEGKIWIDNQDFAIVKITGHLAKSPSFWIKRVDFVRDYQKIDGFWLLTREEAVSVVKIFGKETLTVDYQDYAVNGSRALQSLLKNVASGADRWGDEDLRFQSAQGGVMKAPEGLRRALSYQDRRVGQRSG
jgi:Outer membrane lipoprotein-sorting protein